MSPRADFSEASSGAFRAMLDLEAYLHGCGREAPFHSERERAALACMEAAS